MKKFSIYSFMLVLSMLVFSACEQDRAFPEFADLEYGAYPRLIDGINGAYGTAFNFSDVAGSSIGFTVEFYDENDGKNVSSYAWTVSYNGGTAVSLASASSSSFGTSPDGFPSATFTWTFQEVLNALGITINDVLGGKSFEFLATLTKTDGKVFNRDNTATVLQAQPAYKALFQIRVPIICTSDIGGTFDYVSTELSAITGTCPTAPITGTVTWTEVDEGSYSTTDLGFGQYGSTCWNDNPATAAATRILESCGFLSISGGDQYNLIYTYKIVSINGPAMEMTWTNTYDDSGRVVLTRQDGKNWPNLKTP